jgi:hypothetical protein
MNFHAKSRSPTPSPHEGLVYARWKQVLPTPSDNGDEPYGCVRHGSARIAQSHALITVHPAADHFPHDEQEYVKMDLYCKDGLSDNLVSSHMNSECTVCIGLLSSEPAVGVTTWRADHALLG